MGNKKNKIKKNTPYSLTKKNKNKNEQRLIPVPEKLYVSL